MKRRGSSSPAPTASELFAKAVSRRRERCAVATEYTHANLLVFLETLLPGYCIYAPAPGTLGISSYPAASEDADAHTRELQYLASFLGGIPVAEAKDQYEGHCETLAVAFTRAVMEVLHSAPAGDPASVLHAAFAVARAQLDALPSWEAQVALLFEAEARARRDGAQQDAAARKGRTLAMWEPLLPPRGGGGGGSGGGGGGGGGAAIGTVARSAAAFLAGAPELGARLAEAAAHASSGLAVMPLYVLNYIFDGDELSAADLAVDSIETAQYSCHVVGLVLDGRSRTAFVADPNGALVPGGNMEFLRLPFAHRKQASTAISAFDLAALAKKGKKGGRA
jgi:hypothetical protein